jgi:hypothetical protein
MCRWRLVSREKKKKKKRTITMFRAPLRLSLRTKDDLKALGSHVVKFRKFENLRKPVGGVGWTRVEFA